MDIEKLTIGEAREIAALVGGRSQSKSNSWQTGTNVFIRTVTMYYTGHVEAITDEDVLLSDAAWIPDTGRFSDALKSGEFAEVEPFPDAVVIPRGGIIDWCVWNHKLPRTRKP